MSLECQIGTRQLSCNSEEMARSSCDLEMDRSSYSSENTEPSTCGSDVVMIHDPGLQTITPVVKNLNVVNSKRIVVGPQFLAVTQNVNVVKDLPMHRYIWNVIRNTSKVEKVSCGTSMFVLIVCIVLIIYFVVIANNINDESDTEFDWFIKREKWLAIHYNKTHNTSDNLRLVIIAHTTGPTCNTFIKCTMAVKSLQKYFIYSLGYDIPIKRLSLHIGMSVIFYQLCWKMLDSSAQEAGSSSTTKTLQLTLPDGLSNICLSKVWSYYSFLIGGDGRVYEGRGWNIVGAHTYGYNNCSMGLAFIGDYRKGLPSFANVTDLQQQRAHMLFEDGVKNGHLHPHFHVLGAMDLRPTASPGTKLYNAIRKWPNYDHKNLYKGKSCRQIRELFKNENATSTASEVDKSTNGSVHQ